MRSPKEWLKDWWAGITPSPRKERRCYIRIVDKADREVFAMDTEQLYYCAKYGTLPGEWLDLIGPTLELPSFRIFVKIKDD